MTAHLGGSTVPDGCYIMVWSRNEKRIGHRAAFLAAHVAPQCQPAASKPIRSMASGLTHKILSDW